MQACACRFKLCGLRNADSLTCIEGKSKKSSMIVRRGISSWQFTAHEQHECRHDNLLPEPTEFPWCHTVLYPSDLAPIYRGKKQCVLTA